MNLPMRTVAVTLLASALSVSNAFAADSNAPLPAAAQNTLPAGPLPAGKPADVKQAQIWEDLIGLVGVGVIIAVAISASNHHSSNSSTNTQ